MFSRGTKLLVLAAVGTLVSSPAFASRTYDGNDSNSNTGIIAVISTYPFTACAWFKANPVAAIAIAEFGIAGSSDNRIALRLDATNHAVAFVRTTSNSVAPSSNTFTDDTWAHACIRATSSSDVDVFLNGTKTDSNPALTPTAADRLRFGENNNGTEDFIGKIAHPAVWSISLSDGEVSALAGGDNPLTVQNDGDLEMYVPFLVDDGEDVVNNFDLTLGTSVFDGADNPTVDAAPGGEFTVNPTVTAQDTNDFTLGGTTDGSTEVDAVACAKDSTVGDAAEVDAGTCNGGAALAHTSDTWNGADSLILGGALTLKIYDIYATDGTNLVTLVDEQLDVAAGYERTILSTQDPTSVYTGTETVSGDYCDTQAVTSPSSYVVTPDPDGTIEYAASGDPSRQIVLGDCHDLSESDIDTYEFVFNNLPPVPAGQAFPETLLIQQDVAMTALSLETLAPDPEGDDVTVTNLTANPTGTSIVANELTGTPTVCGPITTMYQWEDEYTATYSEEADFEIGDLVPAFTGNNEAAYIAEVEAICDFDAVAGSPESHATIPVGDVVSVFPVVGALVVSDQVITYRLSSGPAAASEGGRRKSGLGLGVH